MDDSLAAHDNPWNKQAEKDQAFQLCIADSILDAVVATDLDYRILSWNTAAEQLYGWKEEEVLGKDARNFLPTTFPYNRREEWEEQLRTTGYWKGEAVQQSRDGTMFPVLCSVSYVKDRTGTIIGAVAINRDIRVWKQTQQRLQESEQQLHLALETAKLGVWQLDLSTGLFDCSITCKANFGLPPETVFTFDALLEAVLPEDRERIRREVASAVAERGLYETEYRVRWPDTTVHWIAARGQAFYGEDGSPLRMAGMTLEITERKEFEYRKDEFIGIASHELRTPVTALKGYTQLLQRKFVQQGLQEHATILTRMDGQLNRLTKLVVDLLDISKMQMGKVAYSIAPFDFDAWIQNLTHDLQQASAQHTIMLTGAASRKVMGDHDRLEQVFINLITNAIKYSPHAERVDVKIAPELDSVTVHIKDYGVGIPKQHHRKIFDRFYRVSSLSNNFFPGLGVGLYITHEIIQAHNGKIWLESAEEQGSTFFVSLPLVQNE